MALLLALLVGGGAGSSVRRNDSTQDLTAEQRQMVEDLSDLGDSGLVGAVLDVVGLLISFCAAKKQMFEKRKLLPAVIVLMNVFIIAAGIASYQNGFSILSMLGVFFHTNAFWLKDEKKIRIISLLGCPCWMIYNFTSHAYGSALGDLITLFSIGTAMVRYDILKKE